MNTLIEERPGQAGEPPRRLVFFINRFNNGGIESALLQWLRALDRTRFRAALVVGFPSAELEARYRRQVPADVSIEVLAQAPWMHTLDEKRRAGQLGALGRLAREVLHSTVVRPWFGQRLARIARDHDVIVDFDLSLRQFAGRFGIPWIGVNHFSFPARLGGRPAKVRRLARQYRDYDAIAVLNRQMAEEARAMFGEALRALVILPNVIDRTELLRRAQAPAMAPGEAEPAEARHARDAGSARPYLISVARLDEIQKDHATLIKAYALARQTRGGNLDLVIVGDGASRAELEELARTLGLGTHIHFTGYRSNPFPLMRNARALVLSTRYEGMPMALIEAMALGLPVIASDCPTGPRDILDDGRAGILVPVGDVEALALALGTVMSDDARAADLAQRASARAEYFAPAASNARLWACVENVREARGVQEGRQPGA